MRPNRGQTRVPSFAMILLMNELIRSATNYGIPPITLGTIATQIIIFLRIIKLPWDNVWDVCLSFNSIHNKKQFTRLLLSQLNHADDWHLYYNMVSFLWKGRSLERRLGTVRFLFTLIVFTFSTAFAYVLLNKLIAEITGDYSYLHHCSVGFSGVIFALKVLTTHYDRGEVSYLLGVPIGSKYAVWAELVLIQLISPNASFVGHLAGILVGLAYVKGPLKYVVQLLTGLYQTLLTGNADRHETNHRRSQYSNARNFGSYVPSAMSEEEQLRRATEESLYTSWPNHSSSYPTAPPYPPETRPNYYDSPPYPTDDNFRYDANQSNERQSNNIDAETIRRLRLRHYQN